DMVRVWVMGARWRIERVRWTPPAAAPGRHPERLDVEVVALPGEGPEDVLVEDDGSVLTGLLDGRILRISPDRRTITTIADTGSLYRRTPDGELTVLASGRPFPNGVALSGDRNSLFFAETASYGLFRLDLTKPDAQPEQVALIPGLPDNIARRSDGLIWVAVG